METYKSGGRTQQLPPFKSYYVVWKPKDSSRLLSSPLKFKSYYVVWKPETDVKDAMVRGSLNRTMQYGNLRSLTVSGLAVDV